jgi:hypothetical protein
VLQNTQGHALRCRTMMEGETEKMFFHFKFD